MHRSCDCSVCRTCRATDQMCGRYTYKLTWEEIVKLYRLTLDQKPRNIQPRYNVCPTTDVDVVVSTDGKRSIVPMRWGLSNAQHETKSPGFFAQGLRTRGPRRLSELVADTRPNDLLGK